MTILKLTCGTGAESLSVRRFAVQERVSDLFTVNVWARAENPAVDLEAIVGKPASLLITSGVAHVAKGTRLWTGVCAYAEQTHAVVPQPGEKAESTYYLRIVPSAWLMTQRRNYRIFQHKNIPDIADALFAEWSVEPVWEIDRGKYPKLEYKVQYGESDYDFLSRLFEEAGIAFTFPDDEEAGSRITLGDKLHTKGPRSPSIHYVDNPSQAAEKEFVTRVRLGQEVRPGAYVIRDYDFRKPAFPLFGEGQKAPDPESHYEQYHYDPGAFLIEGGKGGDTPVADDKGVARYEQRFGHDRADRALLGTRMGRRSVSFQANVIDLAPGVIMAIANHPHPSLGEDAHLLMIESSLEGSPEGEWTATGHAVFADVHYRPPLSTKKPDVVGVQSAVVVGPAGQEIHTDEFGRVRVQFPWDREGKLDDFSTCWIRVSQGWAGTGFGMIMTPRIGQEVLVGFLAGDPDQPIIVGRVFNATNQVPYKLPDHKTRSTWKSNSTIGGGGFNEIMFEDQKGNELVWVQAQKDLRKLVKNDETITVGRDRQKLVKGNETETTVLNRTEVTGGSRTEITAVNRTTVIGANSMRLVRGDEIEKTEGKLLVFVGGRQDIVITRDKRERVEGSSHLYIKGKRNQRIDGVESLSVGRDRHEKVGRDHALEAGEEIHIKAGSALVIEADHDLTLKGPGGFVRIDSSGVTIKGTMVRINSGGAEGSGKGASPELPEEAVKAAFEAPDKPVPDDVSVTLIGRG